MPTNVLVPDIGDFKDVEVIDVLVKPGDTVELETPLITLETEKATIDVPSSAAGVVASLAVKKGDRVSQGSLILKVEADSGTRIAEAETTVNGGRRTAEGDEKKPKQPADDKSFTDTLVRDAGSAGAPSP
jgi:pyruvate/2-oxoglutarate dehydrogenase complex dihydrolipoamide acyltransferase (E2) component